MCARCDIHEIRPPPLFSPRPPVASCPGLAASLSSLRPCVLETPRQLRRRVESPPVRLPSPVLGRPVQGQQGCLSSCWSRAKRKSIHQITMPSSQIINSFRKALCAPTRSPTCTPARAQPKGDEGKDQNLYTPVVLVCPSCLARRKLPSDH